MTRIDALFDWLTLGPTPECDHILAAGLTHADPDTGERIADILFERAYDASWAGLARNYGRLSHAAQARLRSDPRRWRGALAIALETPEPTQRVHALHAFRAQPVPRLAYLVADALRDLSLEVRRAAAETIRELAAWTLNRDRANMPSEERQQWLTERREVHQAVAEGVRTFDAHYRIEALQAGIWLAQALGDQLWSLLANRRSQSGGVVSERLGEWNEPRIARFLLEGLLRPEWRRVVERLLDRWERPAELVAILENSDLLEQPGMQEFLSARQPAPWVTAIARSVVKLPEHLRARGPLWLAASGASYEQKLHYFTEYLRFEKPDLERTATYALAQLNVDEAIPLMARLAEGKSRMARYAEWYVTGKRLSLIPPGRMPRKTHSTQSGRGRHGPDDFGPAVALPVEDRAELVSILRDNVSETRPALLRLMASADPYKRILALRMIAASELSPHFQEELRPLRGDPVQGIGRFATAVLADAQRRAGGSQSPGVEHGPALPADRATEISDARQELRALLLRLMSDDLSDEAARRVVERVRRILRSIRNETRPAALAAERKAAGGSS